jgi:hypothetical protein
MEFPMGRRIGLSWVNLSAALAPLSCALFFAACAQSNTGELSSGGTGAGQLSTSSSSSSTSGPGGAGGMAGAGGTGGIGGSGGSGGAGGSGNGGSGGNAGSGSGTGGSAGSSGAGGDGGGPTGTVLLLANMTTKVLAASFHPNEGWSTALMPEEIDGRPAVATTGGGEGVGLVRELKTGALRWVGWSPMGWTPFSALGPGITSRAAPALGGDETGAHAIFHGDDYKHYYASFSAGAWAVKAEPVGGAAAQAFGPNPGAVVGFDGKAVAAYPGSDGQLYVQERPAGAWESSGIALPSSKTTQITPTAVKLGLPQPTLLLVFVRQEDAGLYWSSHIEGQMWSAPAPVSATALSQDPVALAPLANGKGAALAYRGLDGKIYVSRFDPAASPPWTPPAGIAVPNPSIPSTPALATGVGGADAELVYIDAATGKALHARLKGGAFGPATDVAPNASGLTHASLASLP